MISVIVPTYQNKKQLLTNLKHNIPFLTGCEIIIVNDNPTQSLKDDLKQFASVTLIENKKNLGFGPTVNRGVEKAMNPYVMLLNDDVQLSDDTYRKSLDYFKKNPLLFALSFAQTGEGDVMVGKNRLYWSRGILQHSAVDNSQEGINAWAEGGACVIQKDKFMELDGFDSVYSPFYWEDIDLSYRAWKRGYQILFTPKIKVKHQHESTIGTHFSKRYIQAIAYRNQFIFIWKNISDPGLILIHILFLPYLFVSFLIRRQVLFIKGFLSAIQYIGVVLQKRSYEKSKARVSDTIILNMFKHE